MPPDSGVPILEDQIAEGRQIYLVYPLIEESATLDHKDLMDGYESIVRRFPPPQYQVAIVHGRMKPDDKAWEMDRFAKGKPKSSWPPRSSKWG